MTSGVTATTVEPPTGFPFGTTAVAFSPRGDRVTWGGHDGTVQEWGWDGGPTEVLRAWCLGGPVTCLAYAPGGQMLLAGDGSARATLWRRQLNHGVDLAVDTVPRSIAWHPDGRNFVLGTVCGWIISCDLDDWSLNGLSCDPLNEVICCQWNPLGALVATGHRNGQLRLWNLDR